MICRGGTKLCSTIAFFRSDNEGLRWDFVSRIDATAAMVLPRPQRQPAAANGNAYGVPPPPPSARAVEWQISPGALPSGGDLAPPSNMTLAAARPSLIPTLCTHFTRAGIEWRH